MNEELKAVLRRDFLAFARKSIVELSGTKIGRDPYLEYLAAELTAFVDGETNRLLVNLPPRHLKTLLFSVCLAAWKFAHEPSAKIMVVTYAEQLAESIARWIRGILQAEWFKEVFPTRIAKDHCAVMDFGTTAGGQLYSASFGGGITGRGADLIIVDDAHDIKDAGNLEQLERTIEIFNTILLSRLNNPKTGKVVVIAHRVHDQDLSGRLLRDTKWRHVALPMVAVSDAEYQTSCGPWLRREGELLRPDAYDQQMIDHLKANTHNPGFDMLYQQDIDGRALPPITEDCFLTFSFPPSDKTPCVMSVDPSMKAGPKSSYSAIQIWRAFNGNHFLIDQCREQCGFAELKQKVRGLIARYQPSAILIEQSANGHALASLATGRNRDLIREITPEGSKRSRLIRNVDTILARRIVLPKAAPWGEDFVAECVAFPYGGFTDQVDAMTQYLDFMGTHPVLKAPPSRCYGVAVSPSGGVTTQTASFSLLGRKRFWR
jgi:predicted phage terminase large subunit-like protein